MSTEKVDTINSTADSVGSVLEFASFEVADYSAVWPDMPEGSYTKKEDKGE